MGKEGRTDARVPQPLLISSSLYLSPIFTTHLFIELFFTLLFLLAIHIWVCDLILSLFKKHSTFYNTILLSIAASCLCVYSLIGSGFLSSIYFYLAYFAGLLFLFLQVCEYQLLCFYISDSFYASSFYLITGLHFSHVIV